MPICIEALNAPQERCIEHALSVLRNISRTFQGESNTDSSAEKLPLTKSGGELVETAERNFRAAVSMLFSLSDDAVSEPKNVQQLFAVTAVILNRDLAPERRNFWRTWETPFEEQTPAAEIRQQMSARFYSQFLERFSSPDADPVEFAYWIERNLDIKIHPLADGCGKTSRALSTWILGRAGLLYPTFESREEYFDVMLLDDEGKGLEKYRSLVRGG